MADLKLKTGDRVRNIRERSSYKGWQGVVVDHRHGYINRGVDVYHVRYDNGFITSYQRHRSAESLERIAQGMHEHINLGKWNITKQAYTEITMFLAYGAPLRAVVKSSEWNEAFLRELVTYMGRTGDIVPMQADKLRAEIDFHFPNMKQHVNPCYDYNRLELMTLAQMAQPRRKTLKKVRRNVITGKTQEDVQKELGFAHGTAEFNTRATGRSTAKALDLISLAMLNPGQHVNLDNVDHAIDIRGVNTGVINKHFRALVAHWVDTMKLRGFTFDKQGLIYNPIVTEETYVEIK